ncbi:MAG: aspartate--tRNA ligase [Gammaproteobacteria bacterium]|nr:aspartate--tRNA ligase [Gammaproteobacteria bacterium]
MRTHYCGNVDEKITNEQVALCGWVHKVRNLGGLVFIDLRDRAGIVQVVVDPEQAEAFTVAEKLHNEYVIKITGQVIARPDNMINPDMATGKIEVLASDVELLSRAKPLPLQVSDYQEVSEEHRLKYRYIDLRRPEMNKNIQLRHYVAQELRSYLNENGFLEIETPMLTRSTPEGARDYLVPSRNYKGSFYALPQSPQQFKQLLMMSGFDRYYQIVRCFRDEDLRADRQPEFTQLDIETSFLDEKTIQDLMEEMMRSLFRKTLQVELPKPFPRISYQEAMQRYGSDRPDLRIPLELIDVADEVVNSEFRLFAEKAKDDKARVAAMRVPNGVKLSRKEIDNYTVFVAKYGAKGLAWIKVLDLDQGMAGIKSPIAKFFNSNQMEVLLAKVKAENEDIIFFVADDFKIVSESLGALRCKIGEDLGLIGEKWAPLWVVDFPMFYQLSDGSWTFHHHPFTSPTELDPQKLLADPGASLSKGYDMVMNGSELGGGSVRIHDPELQFAVFQVLGIDAEEAKREFGHLLEALNYGCPPHAGIAFGLDRIVMIMAGATSIRDVIAFPKTTSASCPLTSAPATVATAQLQELGIKLVEE